jgi:hypothetical protein
MTQRILEDLVKHFENRVRDVGSDFFDRCKEVGVPPGDCASQYMSVLLTQSCKAIAFFTTYDGPELAEVIAHIVEQTRKDPMFVQMRAKWGIR